MHVGVHGRNRIFLLRLSEEATLEYHLEHGLLVRLLVDEPQCVRVRPATGGRNIDIWELLPLCGPPPPEGVPQASVELLQSSKLLCLPEPLGGIRD